MAKAYRHGWLTGERDGNVVVMFRDGNNGREYRIYFRDGKPLKNKGAATLMG